MPEVPPTATTYTNDRAYVNSWLVYINGLQVPCAGVTVTCGVWQIPEASIQMVPDVALARLGAEDRVITQVFYCDQWYRSPPEFCLMFDGEIVAWSYTDAGAGRSLAFQCVDYMAILTQLFFFFMSSFDDIAVGASSERIGVFGNTVSLAGYGALYPYSLFSQGLADPGDSLATTATISRPIDFAYNIVRSLIKAQHPNRSVPAANFFAPWCRKTNFHRRWVALPYLDQDPGGNNNVGVFPVLRAVQAEAAIAAVARMAAGTGTSGSMWDMLRDVLMTMMMEISMIPTPAAVKSDYVSLLPSGKPDGVSPTFLASYFVKPQFFFGLPPSCNVFYPSQINAYNYSENYSTQPTRMYFNEEAILSTLSAGASNAVNTGLATLATDALSTAYPEECNQAIRAVYDLRGLNGKNLLVYPEEFFKGPVVSRRPMPRWFVYLLDALRTPGVVSGGNGGGTPATPAGGGTTSVDSSSEAEAPDAGTINTSGTDIVPISQGDTGPGVLNDTSNTGGATYAVYDTQPNNNYQRAFGNRPIPRYGVTPTASERVWFASRSPRGGPATAAQVGAAVPPQVFPMEIARTNVNALTSRPGGSAPGSFWASRHEPFRPASEATATRAARAEKPERRRFHCGYDFPAPSSAYDHAVFATTAGHITQVQTVTELGGSSRTFAGNWLQITDARGGVHRYMHLDRFVMNTNVQPPRAFRRGDEVHAGQHIAFAGNSAIGQKRNTRREGRGADDPDRGGMGRHLHYDVTSNRGYRLDYTDVLVALYNGRAAPTQGAIVQEPTGAPPAPDDPTPAPHTPGAPTVTTANVTQSADTSRDLFRMYAEYEYFKERYSRRQGAVELAFNPYVVPGFPCATFDRRSSAVDTFGYVMSVRWTLTPHTWGTTVAFSHGRTFQEMFSLMQRTYATSAARIGLAQAELETAVVAQDQSVLGRIARPVGAIAVAPAEPIEEIRDVIQSFVRAGQFYLALFHQQVATGADALTAVQQDASRFAGSDTLYMPYQTAQDIAEAARENDVQTQTGAERVREGAVAAAEAAVNRPPPLRTNNTPGSRNVPQQKGVFYYPDIIDFVDPTGARSGIEIEGADGSSTTRMLGIVRAMRAIPTGGLVSQEDRQFYADVYEERVALPETGQPLTEETIAQLNARELALRTATPRSNLRGDVAIVPRDGAQSLFESYTAAMAYNGRPVCTLDEYIDFHGEQGLREGPVALGSSVAGNSQQTHPAPYYTRIRRLRQGPPSARPLYNTTNTSVSTDGPVGGSSAVPSPDAAPPLPEYVEQSTQDAVAAVQAIGVEITEELASDFLRMTTEARNRPGGTTAEDQEAFDRALRQAFENREIAPDVYNRLSQILQGYPEGVPPPAPTRTAPQPLVDAAAEANENVTTLETAVATAQANATAATAAAAAEGSGPAEAAAAAQANAALEALTTALSVARTRASRAATRVEAAQSTASSDTAPAPAGSQPINTYPVDGIPLDFPQTRADWDSALEQYRSNVLTKLPPYR